VPAGLRARLVKGGPTARAAANAVKELVADGWLNDRAFAEGRVEQLRTRGAMAAEALEALLEADGVGERDAREAAKAGAGTAAELRKEAKAARKAGESANRVAGRMGRRGFDPDTIRNALEHAGYRLDD
jgi:SOS response regulatory protein OraA/RecX